MESRNAAHARGNLDHVLFDRTTIFFRVFFSSFFRPTLQFISFQSLSLSLSLSLLLWKRRFFSSFFPPLWVPFSVCVCVCFFLCVFRFLWPAGYFQDPGRSDRTRGVKLSSPRLTRKTPPAAPSWGRRTSRLSSRRKREREREKENNWPAGAAAEKGSRRIQVGQKKGCRFLRFSSLFHWVALNGRMVCHRAALVSCFQVRRVRARQECRASLAIVSPWWSIWRNKNWVWRRIRSPFRLGLSIAFRLTWPVGLSIVSRVRRNRSLQNAKVIGERPLSLLS